MAYARIPADTLARIARLHAAGYKPQAIADRVGRSRSTICKVVARGFRPRKVEHVPPVPGDFGLYAYDETMAELRKRYGRGSSVVRAWIKAKGIVRPDMRRRCAKRAVPADFAARAPGMSREEQTKEWRVTGYVLTRWRLECGLPTPMADLRANRRRDAERAAQSAAWKRSTSRHEGAAL